MRWRRVAVAATVAAVAAVSGMILGVLPRGDQPARVVRFSVPLGNGGELYLGGGAEINSARPTRTSIALSPDGVLLAYVAWEREPGPERSRLYVQNLEQDGSTLIDGTDGASSPFFSPDGVWVGFFVGSSLRRIRVSGGAAETIVADTRLLPSGPQGTTWGDDDTIVYGGADGLYRVAAAGGTPELVAQMVEDAGFPRFAQPHYLPGSDVVLFHFMPSYHPARAEIRALDLRTGTQTTVLTNGLDARYVDTGHLLFAREGTLLAVPFDAERIAVRGEPVVLYDDVAHALYLGNQRWSTGAAQYVVSPAGHLAYTRGGVYRPTGGGAPLRVTPSGAEPLSGGPENMGGNLRVSPEGDRLAYSLGSTGAGSIFVHDRSTGVTQPLNTGGSWTLYPVWSPDGRWIAFSSDRSDFSARNIYRMASDGGGEPERLAESPRDQVMQDWSSDGVIAYLEDGDIWMLTPGGQASAFFESEAIESHVSFSPDGGWVSYTSTDARGEQVYVRPYPGPGPATPVSAGSGTSAAWSRDGARIYYLAPRSDGTNTLMRVDVASREPLRTGRPSVHIDPWPYTEGALVRFFDPLSDGSFAVGQPIDPVTFTRTNGVAEIRFVLNFFSELNARVPVR